MISRRLNKALIAASLSFYLFNSISIYAIAAMDSMSTAKPALNKDQSVSQDQTPGSKSSMTTVKPDGSSQQESNINVQQLPNLLEVPQTAESIEKVNKMEEERRRL